MSWAITAPETRLRSNTSASGSTRITAYRRSAHRSGRDELNGYRFALLAHCRDSRTSLLCLAHPRNHPRHEGDAMALLKPGDHFPPITITPVDGEPIDLSDALAGHYAVILFNRGSWCPYCNAQLRAFQRDAEQLDGLDIKVLPLSADDQATARSAARQARA